MRRPDREADIMTAKTRVFGRSTRARHGVYRTRPLGPPHFYSPISSPANERCGALTRRGTPCQRKALANGRCPNHGGLSTGPKTEAGRKRIAAAVSAAQRRRWAAWRRQRAGAEAQLKA